MGRNSGFQQGDQFRLHERIVVGNVETDNFCLAYMLFKLAVQFGAMSPFHNEYDI